MSVEVKTPSPAHFEHKEFPFSTQNEAGKDNDIEKPCSLSKDDSFTWPTKQVRKRRSSEAFAYKAGSVSQKRRFSHKGRSKIVLPTKFLLGGNINDPLNLNSLNDEKVNAALNAETPKSSPLPTPTHRQQVKVLIPSNINDPLNLNSGEDLDPCLISPKHSNKKKKKHHGKKRKSVCDAPSSAEAESEKTITDSLKVIVTDEVDTNKNLNDKLQDAIDKVITPPIPQPSPKPRKRTISEKSTASIAEDPSSKLSPVKAKTRKISSTTTSTQFRKKKKVPTATLR